MSNKQIKNKQFNMSPDNVDSPPKGSKCTGEFCNSCEKELSTWDLRCSKALAYKIPVCESCIAKEYGITAEELRSTLKDFFGIRPCLGL